MIFKLCNKKIKMCNGRRQEAVIMMERSHSSASDTRVPEVQETITHKLQKIIEGVESFAEHTTQKISHKIDHFREKSRIFDLIVDMIIVNVANYELFRALEEVFHLTLKVSTALLHSYDLLGKFFTTN